mmetsp:Transcript_19672/g.30334  ORF Transcript_19672/g.30334 Transcript_19672/m.30334 type:complete len:350 (-) Transcript_19672:1147-2196(-)|eukprot:CAMPEP_0195300662 /NCGR_PEP_ID=MMETSP0707-20130614/27874_1 /TAXON_ID=33640 /ORGANISM="Asterionellopsis glacialis, Strain CCMP134" /LENGTH=349 /DNA_ID=CAMNT_0040363417 /DNA_START=203 /DNA_END=1252 /DNA_ORIENTATION=-
MPSHLSDILEKESVPDVSQISVAELRCLYKHMCEYYPGTLANAWKEMKESDAASVETEKIDNRTTKNSRPILRAMSEGDEDAVEDPSLELATKTAEGSSSLTFKSRTRRGADDEGSGLRPSIPNHQSRRIALNDDIEFDEEDDLITITPTRPSVQEDMDDADKPGIPQRSVQGSVVKQPNISGSQIGCYLVYDSDSSGKLMLNYSKTSVDGAIGFWAPGEGKKIQGFKFTQNAGRSELIGNCASGVAGRKNYYSGWCQFVRAARLLKGSVTLIPVDEGQKALPVDVFLYCDDERAGRQTVKLDDNKSFDVSSILAVACLPKHTPFYTDLSVNLTKWMTEGNTIGAASSF